MFLSNNLLSLQESVGTRGMYVSTASNLPNVMEGFLKSNCDSKSCGHCLTLVVDRNDSVNELTALGQVVQMKRPVAILFTGVEDSHSLVEHFKSVGSSFPILIMPDDERSKLKISTSMLHT